MPRTSNFSFIGDEILKENLDITFDHLLELLSLSETPKYTEIVKSSFRKTTIIYTASIIEALLLWILKKRIKETDLKREIKTFKISKDIYKVNSEERIVLGKDVIKTEQFKFSRLNLADINSICKTHRIITDKMFKDVDKVRELRNRLHIATLEVVEKDYTKIDLEFVFSVAREVKNFAKG